MNMEQTATVNTINPRNPHGLGDPNDTKLRKVEMEVLIPKIMRDRAREILCTNVVEPFKKCCKENGILMVVACRTENSNLKDCLTKWYQNEAFKEECKQIYLKERSDYRRTGIPKKQRMDRVKS